MTLHLSGYAVNQELTDIRCQVESVNMYDLAWRQLRRVRRVALSAVLVWVVWLLVEARLDPSWEVTKQLATSFVVCAAFWNYAILRYLWWRCPRCNSPFQAGFILWPGTIWPRKQCIHCGLHVGT